MIKLPAWVALAGALIATGTLQAQTYVPITNLLFAEDFSNCSIGALPKTQAEGGLWESISWLASGEGSASVITDDENVFGQGAQNQFFRVASTRNLTMQSPTFFAQEVAVFEFDFIGHVLSGDGARWLQAAIRTGAEWAHITSLRNNNATIRTATTDAPANPSYGGNDKAIRIWTVMNNGAEAIAYDRPDGAGTANLPATSASVWIYHYDTSTWEYLIPNYIYGRTSTLNGRMLDNLRFLLDSNAALRSYDLDNVKVYGARQLLPPVQVAITNLLFKDDFDSYTVGQIPATTDNGGKWATATWAGTNGTAAIAEDIGDVFGLGVANRYYQLSNTHNVFLITPVFNPKQEAITYAFDFVGHYFPYDGVRWLNVDARNATSAAHITSLTMNTTLIRGSSASYGANDSLVRVHTVLNNREGNIIYDRPDGTGTATLGSAKASLWLHTAAYGWEQVIPEFIYARSAGFPLGPEIDRLRLYMDSNADFRSFDMDNFEIYGTIKPIAPPAVLAAEAVGGKMRVRWMGVAGTAYQVQYRAELNSGDWVNVGTPIQVSVDGEQTFEENLAETVRFYQVEQASQ